jgi:shikimate kinase
MLGRALIDLDETFLTRIGDIGSFIRDEGYAAYKAANSKLAAALVDQTDSPAVLVTSSGFLTADNPPEVLAANHALLGRGYCVSLLPSVDLEAAVETIATRQMSRFYHEGVDREAHAATARARFMTYWRAGDLLVCSSAPPDAVAQRLDVHLR